MEWGGLISYIGHGLGKRSERRWKNTVVAHTHKGGNGPHILGIQLSHGHTTNEALHEHCNY
jgi:hypothetical protein